MKVTLNTRISNAPRIWASRLSSAKIINAAKMVQTDIAVQPIEPISRISTLSVEMASGGEKEKDNANGSLPGRKFAILNNFAKAFS